MILLGDNQFACFKADAIEFMRQLPDNSVDLVFGSPPYEQARLYLENGEDMGIARSTEAWVSWMVEIYREAARVCKGLVAFVVEGQTRKFRYTAGPILLAADLCRAGFNLRKPPIFRRIGIPGSGGPDWLRNDHEMIVCVTPAGKLPWSDNTACGHPPKWAPGGEMSHQTVNGRVNDPWGKRDRGNNIGGRARDGSTNKGTTHKSRNGEKKIARRASSGHGKDQDTRQDDVYAPPAVANPGNVITCKVGGGLMGSDLAHENEAPFPEALSDFFVKSFCPPGGIVLDCFLGSGTTLASAVKHGRRGIGCDLRQSQVDLAKRRIPETQPVLFG